MSHGGSRRGISGMANSKRKRNGSVLRVPQRNRGNLDTSEETANFGKSFKSDKLSGAMEKEEAKKAVAKLKSSDIQLDDELPCLPTEDEWNHPRLHEWAEKLHEEYLFPICVF